MRQVTTGAAPNGPASIARINTAAIRLLVTVVIVVTQPFCHGRTVYEYGYDSRQTTNDSPASYHVLLLFTAELSAVVLKKL